MSGKIGSAGSRSGTIGETELDYEEGTWTIDIYDASSGGNVAGKGTNKATYTKIGNQVMLQGYMAVSSKGSMTSGNSIYIRGLPFSSTAIIRIFSYGSIWISSATYTGELMVNINSGGNDYAQISIQVTGAEPTYMPVSGLHASLSEVKFTLVYTTD